MTEPSLWEPWDKLVVEDDTLESDFVTRELASNNELEFNKGGKARRQD